MDDMGYNGTTGRVTFHVACGSVVMWQWQCFAERFTPALYLVVEEELSRS